MFNEPLLWEKGAKGRTGFSLPRRDIGRFPVNDELKGVGPDELKIDQLIERIRKNNFQEIILATNTTAEGEATAHYLAKLLTEFNLRITRLAMGLPVGSDLDFADQITIKRALEGRTEIKD